MTSYVTVTDTATGKVIDQGRVLAASLGQGITIASGSYDWPRDYPPAGGQYRYTYSYR